jgi:nudix-type nucleoside diphosphatase (YffH/AdpP family)
MNPQVKTLSSQILSDLFYTLKLDTFEYHRSSGEIQTLKRIVFDRGNGAAVLLYNKKKETFVLTKQLRYPVRTNKHNGAMIEVCAGLLDELDPLTCVKKEAEEETGYEIFNIKKIMEIHPSPGAVTEILHLFIAEYSDENKIADGGGLIEEGEDIEVLEISYNDVYKMIETGEITDAKTIILLQYAQMNF